MAPRPRLQMVGGARLSTEQRDVILAVRDAFLRSVGALMARRRQLVSTIQVQFSAAAAVVHNVRNPADRRLCTRLCSLQHANAPGTDLSHGEAA